MSKFILKCFFTFSILLLGVIVGVQLASKNLVEMTGNRDFSTITLNSYEEFKVEAQSTDTINHLTSHDLDGKKEKIKRIEGFNLFSHLGIQLSNLLNKIFSTILDKIMGIMQSVLN
ncbi:MAG: YqxA family protein [Bacillaceae bacterium]|nr:YqxA family protein [Bacillaceae bacterium]